MKGRVVTLVSVTAFGLGCAEIRSAFQCHDDAACVRDGIAGVCEATGHCSFPDAGCVVTRRRYGPHAGELSETCVVTGQYRWVAPDGDDTAAGTETDPWQTLGFGVIQLGPGDALLVKPGIYDETLGNNVPGGESWERPVTVAAVPPRGATLRSIAPTLALREQHQHYIVIEGLVMDSDGNGEVATVLVEQDHIELRDCVVTGSPFMGIALHESTAGDGGWNVLRGLEIHDNGVVWATMPACGQCDAAGTPCDCDDATGMCTNATCAPNTMCPPCGVTGGVHITSDHNLIDGCTIRDNEGAGIGLDGGASNVMRRNLVTHSGSRAHAGIFVYATSEPLVYDNVIVSTSMTVEGISLWSAGTDARIFANTLVGTSMRLWSGVQRATVQNNIADAFDVEDDGVAMVSCSAGPLDVLIGTVGPNCTNDEFPHFVDALDGDYHLVASSPARNSGVPLPDVTIDFDGKPRPAGPAFDMGAFEYSEP